MNHASQEKKNRTKT